MFDRISSSAPDPLLLVDTTGAIRDANDAAAREFQYSRDALRALALADLGDARADGRFTARYRRADGTHFACEVNAGRVAHDEVLCILRTLEPRTAEDLYAQCFRRGPVAVSIVDMSDNTFVDINDAFLASTGFAREQVIGKTFVQLGIKLSMDDILKVARAVLNEDPTPLEIRTTSANGRVTDALQTHQFVTYDGKRCVIAYGIDITAQKRLEDELRQAQKMEAVGRLAGGVAHDFNNILTAVLGRAEMMLEVVDDSPLARRHAEQLRRAAQRAAALARQLLAFSRKQVMQSRVVDVNAVVTNLGAILQRMLGEDVELRTELTPDAVCVRADPSHLEQVVLNLAANARDAMPGGGQLTLRTLRVDATVHLEVIDTGTGIDDETRRHLFEPFFTTKPDGRGTGLGLSSAYGIVTQSGGTIEVDSAPGAGSTFRIMLPRVDERPSPEVRPFSRKPKKGNQRILLVEDDVEVRTFMRDALESQGYTVAAAGDGHEALLLAAENAQPIHLLVTDIVMPRMSGTELARRLEVLRPDVRTLFITGHPGDSLGTLDAGARVLSKPFTVSQLAQQIREALEQQT